MRVYFAAPLFSEAELEYNEKLCAQFEERGYSVFLPQRDGYEGLEGVYADVDGIETEEDAQDAIFELDRSEIIQADVMTAILDGQVPDEGVAVEIGVAHENDVPIIGLKTDRRNDPLNAMVVSPLTELVDTPEELLDRLESYA